MKRVKITGKRQATLEDIQDPTPGPNEALMKIWVAPMCAEYKSFEGGDSPTVIGHEAAGEVVSAPEGSGLSPGDRVVAMPLSGCGTCGYCRSGEYIYCPSAFELAGFATPRQGMDTMAQYLVRPPWLLCPIPESMTYERAALACCGLGPSFGAFQRMGLADGQSLLITGAGPVGLGALVNARFRGVQPIVVESVPFRAERARRMGAAAVVDPGDPNALSEIRKLSGGAGVDCAIECAGAPEAERLCVDAVRARGSVAVIGECYRPLELKASPDLIRKGLTILGSWHYNLHDYPAITEVIRTSPLVDQLISHVIPMSRIQEAFELSASRQTAKVMLKPWE